MVCTDEFFKLFNYQLYLLTVSTVMNICKHCEGQYSQISCLLVFSWSNAFGWTDSRFIIADPRFRCLRRVKNATRKNGSIKMVIVLSVMGSLIVAVRSKRIVKLQKALVKFSVLKLFFYIGQYTL